MATNQSKHEGEQKPPVLIHRLPAIKLRELTDFIRPHFHLLEPHDDETNESFLLRDEEARSVRVLVSVKPAYLTAELLSLLPRLELVVGTSAGLDRIDLAELRRRNITITNTSDAFCEDVADYAVGLLIDVLRRVSSADRFVRRGAWPVEKEYHRLGHKLSARRIGIVGLGNIGKEIAKRLQSFGCIISYNSRNKKPDVPFTYHPNIHDLAVNSDVLILCCSLTPQTYHIINRDVMTALGKSGVIINVGRGPLIDETELVQFLVRGDISGVGLDVFEHEPHVPKELIELDNVVLSPHQAVWTPESFVALQELVLSNLKAFFENKPLSSVFST